MKKVKKLVLDKEVITSLSVSEMDTLIGGVNQWVDNPELDTQGALCIPDTNYPGCDSFGCVGNTDGCPEPPQKETHLCTGNGCFSGKDSCVCSGYRCEEFTKAVNCGTVFSVDYCEPI